MLTEPKKEIFIWEKDPVSLQRLRVKIFADGARIQGIQGLCQNPLIQGITTNPSLMKKAGVQNYERFAKEILAVVKDKPVSLEVFADNFLEMKRQAIKIARWQSNVYVKVPITNTKGDPSFPLIKELVAEGVKVNVTAVFLIEQVQELAENLSPELPAIVSIFAGRIADTGRDPMHLVRRSRRLLEDLPRAEILWASVREILNIVQADHCGCHIITVPHEILVKAFNTWGVPLKEMSLSTVRQFFADALSSGYSL